jgi:hypothetical protein
VVYRPEGQNQCCRPWWLCRRCEVCYCHGKIRPEDQNWYFDFCYPQSSALSIMCFNYPVQ